eukprot:1895194-Pyramimonas_sp.AAC.2
MELSRACLLVLLLSQLSVTCGRFSRHLGAHTLYLFSFEACVYVSLRLRIRHMLGTYPTLTRSARGYEARRNECTVPPSEYA